MSLNPKGRGGGHNLPRIMSSKEIKSCTNEPLAEILEQASQWSVADDLKLLEWMQNISLNMEARAQRTTNALRGLDRRMRNTSITLDNTINSLVALQSGNQFVESCIQEDDDLVDKPRNTAEEDIAIPTSRDELLNIILDNNIEAIEECFEKVSLEIDDSGDEDDDDPAMTSSVTYVYKPKSMYEGPPLPYIYGTQEWNDHWHVGLAEETECNRTNDDNQDAYSTSSSSSPSPTEDTESLASTSTIQNLPSSSQLSWKSSILKSQNSLDQTEINKNLNLSQNVSTKNFSETGSTSTDSLVFVDNNFDKSNSDQIRRVMDSNRSNTEIINEPILQKEKLQKAERVENSSKLPKNISANKLIVKGDTASSEVATNLPTQPKAPPRAMQRNIAASKELPETPSTFEDLFGGESESESKKVTPNKSVIDSSEMKCKPVNLFDDNDFQSFMDELNSKTLKIQKEENKNNEGNGSDRLSSKETDGKPDQKEQSVSRAVIDKPLRSLFSEDEDEEEEFLNIYKRTDRSNEKENVTASDEKRDMNKSELHLPIYDRKITIRGPKEQQGTEVKEKSGKVLIKSTPNEQRPTNLFADEEEKDENKNPKHNTVSEKNSQSQYMEKEKEKDISTIFNASPIKKESLSEPPKRYDLKSYLFLDDEPPDDDDFFESLKKSQDRSYSSKLFDDEEEEEESLPVKSIPSNNSTVSNLQRTLQPPSNATTYGGLHFINDIPPEDFDDQPNSIGGEALDSVRNPQHLVTNIFYDDFSETIEAINKQPTSQMSFCVFNEEPPPVEEGGISAKFETPSATNIGSYNAPVMATQKEDTLDGAMNKIKPLQTTGDHQKPSTVFENNTLWNVTVEKDSLKQELRKEDKLGSVITEDDTSSCINSEYKIPEKCSNRNTSPNKLIGKLKSNLNINVNALLPIGYKTATQNEKGNVSPNNIANASPEGQQESSYNTINSNEDETNSWTEVNAAATKHTEISINNESRSGNYNYILPSLNKLRVRGPAQRRTPSRKSNTDKQEASPAGIKSINSPSTENRSETPSSETALPSTIAAAKTDNTFRSSTPFEGLLESQNVLEGTNTSAGVHQSKDMSSEMEISLPAAVVSASINQSVQPSFASLFDDEEDDFETLFGIKEYSKLSLHQANLNTSVPTAVSVAPPSNPSKSQLISTKPLKNVPEGDNIRHKENSSPRAKKMEKKYGQTNLFGDTDEEDDESNLFGGAMISKPVPAREEWKEEPKKAYIKKASNSTAASLFDSDSEDDDDLFKRPAKPVQGKSLQAGVKLPERKSLFSDDEDDADDANLFGGFKQRITSQKQEVSTALKRVAEGKDKMPPKSDNNVKAMAPDNPLADLL